MVAACACSSTCPSITHSRHRRGRRSGVASQGILGSTHRVVHQRPPRSWEVVAPWPLSHYHCSASRRPASRPHGGGGPVVLTLLESKWKTGKKRLFGVGFASLAIHSAMIAGVVYATLDAAPRDDQVRMYTTVVLLAPQEQQQAAEPPPVQLADALQGFQTVAMSAQIPTDMPPVDLQQRFDPKDYSGSGVEGGLSGNEVYAEALVEERPALLSAPAPVYPALLKQARIQGRVILPAVIDTLVRAGAAGVRLLQST